MFALCDQRAFYASCELVFNPKLRLHNKVAVKSLNDGAIIALTDEAKKIGLKKFKPFFQQKELCERHGVEVFSANFQLYGEISKRIMQTLESEVPEIEVYSIDEAFCDFKKIVDPKVFAQYLRKRIWKEQRIQMGVSIAPSKTLAKLGQNATKLFPQINGVCYLEKRDQWEWLAKRLPVNEVWGVGSALTNELNKFSIYTAYELLCMRESLAKKLGGINLERTVVELNGTPIHTLETMPLPKKQIIHSRSFGERTTNMQVLREALATFASAAAVQLRKQNSCAGEIQIFIQTSRFDLNPVYDCLSLNIPGGTDDSSRLIKLCGFALEKIFRKDVKYSKAGVILLDVRPASAWQQDIFISEVHSAKSKSMKVIDSINRRFGNDTVRLAAQGVDKLFASRKNNLSPSYLSSWKEIPIVYMG